MKNYCIDIIVFFLISSFSLSCNKPECINANSVFDKYPPKANEYKSELANQLKQIDHTKLSYWLDKYQKVDSLEYLYVFIQGEGLCAKGIVLIKEWDDKLEGIQKTKGIGYSGAELVNLQIEIYQNASKTEFIYKSVDAIVD